MPLVATPVVKRPPFGAGSADRGFRLAVGLNGPVHRSPVVHAPVLNGLVIPAAVVPAAVIGIVKTAFVIEDNIVRRAVFRICHRLQLLT
jgi:hypothetical protein